MIKRLLENQEGSSDIHRLFPLAFRSSENYIWKFKPMKINPENGSIILPDCNIISARTTLDDWIACFPKSSPNHLQTGITFFGLSFTKQSEQYTLTAQFEQQRLERLSIFFYPIGEDNSWAAWSEERELQRRKQFDRWLDKQLGDAPCSIKASLSGKCRQFAWGNAGAYYHNKDGSTMIVISYR